MFGIDLVDPRRIPFEEPQSYPFSVARRPTPTTAPSCPLSLWQDDENALADQHQQRDLQFEL